MTKDLTEQLKNGELETGKEYWVRLTDEWKNSIEQVYFNGENFERFDIDDVKEVLAPVSSYEEWQQLKSHDEKATIKLGEVCIENLKLKELLKLCKENIENYRNGKKHNFTADNIVRMIDNAIGEKK